MAELVAAVGCDEENVPPELHIVILYCIALYCTVLYCTDLHIVILAVSAPSHRQVIEVDEEP